MNKLSQAVLEIKSKVMESTELKRFFLSMVIFMVHKNQIQNVSLRPSAPPRKIHSDTVHLSFVSQMLTTLVLSHLTVQEKSTFILRKII